MNHLDPFNHHILSVLVQNRPGVLARVAGLFARRGFNIFSLAVAPAEDEGFSRITIVVDVESTPLEQITKQLFKLIEVIKISELDPRRSVERELILLTVRAQPDDDVDAGVLQVQRVAVALRAVADDGNRLALEQRRVGVVGVVHVRGHEPVFPFTARNRAWRSSLGRATRPVRWSSTIP